MEYISNTGNHRLPVRCVTKYGWFGLVVLWFAFTEDSLVRETVADVGVPLPVRTQPKECNESTNEVQRVKQCTRYGR